MNEEINYKEILEWAVDISNQLPEKYQVVAFRSLVNHKFNNCSTSNDNINFQQMEENKRGRNTEVDNRNFPPAYLLKEKGTRKQQVVWAVMKLFKENTEANNKTIRDCIVFNLAIQSETRQNTNKTLGKLVPKFISRVESEDSKGHAYTPTEYSGEIFEGLTQQ